MREVEFSGHFERSQLVVGEHNTVHLYEGTVVQQLAPGEIPAPEPRSRPQNRLPKAAAPALGRECDVEVADGLLAQGLPVEFYGPPGIGKSAMLTELALGANGSRTDGIVHHNVGGTPLEDVLQWLFEVFWETKQPWAPGRLRVGEYLRDLQALVVLDDVATSADEMPALLAALEGSTVLIAATEPRLDAAADGTVALRGLPGTAAITAFERCLRRPLEPDEADAVQALVTRLEGVPALVLDSARLVRDGVASLSDLASEPAAALERRRVIALSDAQRRLLALLVELAPAAAPVELLEQAVDVSGADAEALEEAGFAESRSPRYALSRPLSPPALEELPRPEPDRVLTLLAEVARREALSPEWAPAVVAALEWGRRVGELNLVATTARAVDGMLLRALRIGAWGMVLESGFAAAHEVGRATDEAYFLHQMGTRYLLLGEHERAEEYLKRALAVRNKLGEDVGFAATRFNLGVLHGTEHRRPLAAGAAAGAALAPIFVGRFSRGTFAVIGLAAGVALGVSVGSQSSGSNLAATQVSGHAPLVAKTVVLPGRVITRTISRPVTAVPTRASVRTLTVAGPARVVTATATIVAAPRIVTHTVAATVTHTVATVATHVVTTRVPTSVCIDCKP